MGRVFGAWVRVSLVTLLWQGPALVSASPVQELADQASQLADNGYVTSAMEIYQRAIVLDAEKPLVRQDASLHFNLALLFINTEQTDQAVASLEQALRIKPDHLKGHFNLGLLYAGKGKKAEAQRELSTALALSSGNAPLASFILETIEKQNLTDKNSSAASPGSPASPSSDSNTAQPEKTGP
ncbi:tetratricopeptide repeat protein [Anthocerotibacter panamensis]|uniref:tetratricopeptide repeat protein n=1 Tax=Anthocerotibacter panamensis TaxID=2857077 RepID=UPI001C4020A2|nr:tetratricopeptide repeat protein [Anthocerotibacter panamensis]